MHKFPPVILQAGPGSTHLGTAATVTASETPRDTASSLRLCRLELGDMARQVADTAQCRRRTHGSSRRPENCPLSPVMASGLASSSRQPALESRRPDGPLMAVGREH